MLGRCKFKLFKLHLLSVVTKVNKGTSGTGLTRIMALDTVKWLLIHVPFIF